MGCLGSQYDEVSSSVPLSQLSGCGLLQVAPLAGLAGGIYDDRSVWFRLGVSFGTQWFGDRGGHM